MTKKLNIDPINTWINDDSDPLIISGPCSAETFDQLYETCKQLKSYGINIMRAGVWKPRTRPGTFEGNGEDSLITLYFNGAEVGTEDGIMHWKCRKIEVISESR